MSDDLVKRYDLQQPTHHMGSAELVCDTYGDWVLYRDYKALLDLSSVALCNLHREYDKRGDRIEELDDIIRHDRERIVELVTMVNSKDARIEELEAKLAKAIWELKRNNDALEVLRPVWAQGWTNDSNAAQASGAALAQLWNMLGVQDQTQAVVTLAELKGEDRG
jgi:hypothetical protein